MAYLLDSDRVIDHLLNIPEAVTLMDRLAEQGLAISVITYLEVYQGTLRSPDPEKAQDQFEAFLTGVIVLPLSQAVARRYAHLRHTLKQRKRRIHSRALDLIIAATALEHDLTLVTRNTIDYNDIPDLKLYPAD